MLIGLPSSVHSGYYKISQTRWLVNCRNLFLTVHEVGKFKIMVPADLLSG